MATVNAQPKRLHPRDEDDEDDEDDMDDVDDIDDEDDMDVEDDECVILETKPTEHKAEQKSVCPAVGLRLREIIKTRRRLFSPAGDFPAIPADVPVTVVTEVVPEKVIKIRKRCWVTYTNDGVIFPHPENARRFLLEYKDFVVCYDISTRAPCWTIEEIRKERGGLNEGEIARFEDREDRRVAKEFRVGFEDYDLAFDAKLQHLAAVDFHVEGVGDRTEDHDDRLRTGDGDEDDVNIGDPCVFTNVVAQRIEGIDESVRTVWDEFHDYIDYLSSIYKSIFILSGCLYLPRKCSQCSKWVVHYETIPGKEIAIPTHFYKVILYQNPDQTFHLECYKFENKPHKTHDLRNLLVCRTELEKKTGFLIFNKVKEAQIQDTTTDQTFAKYKYYKATRTLTPEDLQF